MTGLAIILVVAALFAFGMYLSMTAGRLDQLNKRVETARNSLELQLLRRMGTVADLTGSGLLDPTSELLLRDATHEVRTAEQREGAENDNDSPRWVAESNMSKALRAVFAEPEDVAYLRSLPGGPEMASDLDAVTRRVELSRRFHNDAVRACRDVRAKRLVRWFRLAGRAAEPITVEMDDAPPAGFGSR